MPQIADLIQQVQQGTKRAVAGMELGANSLALGTDKAHQAGQALRDILQSAATEEFLASAEEMTAHIDHMRTQADALSLMADQLDALVAQFTVDAPEAESRFTPLRRAA